jgi:hypothetical protein
MPSLLESITKVTLKPSLMATAARIAHEEGLSLSEFIADIVTRDLINRGVLSAELADSALAELDLIAFTKAQVDARREEDDWDEHITLQTFGVIQETVPDLYHRALQNDDAGRINRRIGALIRRRLNADVKMANGKRALGTAPRNANSLIKTYTLLERRKKEGGT